MDIVDFTGTDWERANDTMKFIIPQIFKQLEETQKEGMQEEYLA